MQDANLLFVDLANKRKNIRLSGKKMYFLQKMFIAGRFATDKKKCLSAVHKEYMALLNNDDTFMFNKLESTRRQRPPKNSSCYPV